MSEPTPPTPPPGYQTPLRLRYPTAGLQAAAIALLVLAAPLLVWLSYTLRGDTAVVPPIDALGAIAALLAAIVVTVVVHEWVHGLAYQALGYKVSYGVSLHLGAAYAGAFGQWQRRGHNLLVALAPLLLLSPLLLLAVARGGPQTAQLAFAALLFNISGAVGDLYLAYRLLRMPPAALLYDADPKTMWYALPER
jgi:hypothetical protein